ncbi:MAG: DNA-binding protein WhiA [Bifidobacteriaceae bacterium]|jgi:DNA-binding protein WhiA|nr:DNA-binding protein WhiA [Bifidobacteriaceae bacterium]
MMNWTKDAIDEIAKNRVTDDNAKKVIASVALRLNGELKTDGDSLITNIHVRSAEFAKKLSGYIKVCYGKNCTIIDLKSSKIDNNLPHLIVQCVDKDNSLIVKAGLTDKTGMPVIGFSPNVIQSNKQLLKYACASAFLSVGKITDPEKNGVIEMTAPTPDLAIALNGIVDKLDIESKIRSPRGVDKVVIREKYDIADFLTFIGAPKTADEVLIKYRKTTKTKETIIIHKKSDTNYLRSYHASQIAIIRAKRALEIMKGEQIKDELVQAAKTRIKNPNASLEKLGSLCSPPISKDAIASRLRRLNKIADETALNKSMPDTKEAVKQSEIYKNSQ